MGYKHGGKGTRLYRIWQMMKNRCHNPKTPRFKDYGARGITVCDEWKDDFKTFYDWSMSHGYEEHLTIDRIDNDKGYSPDNCRWATYLVQGNNSRHNHTITYGGETHSLSDWARKLGIPVHVLSNRINKYDWTVERAFTTPVGNQGRKKKGVNHIECNL